MKAIEVYKKISWLISLSLGLFYLISGYSIYQTNFNVASKAFFFAIFWFLLAYILKKTIKKDIDFLKTLEFSAFVFSFSKTENEISQKRLEYLFFILNKRKKILEEIFFDDVFKVPEKISKICKRSILMFSKSRSLKANPYALFPENILSNEEKDELTSILNETDSLSDMEIYKKINE